ncbi:hypothetical protein [Parvibaculum sp.]|uniref:hypothetical protein n=1 Tax=Parvibaculum sp. TaxID=2024848 RepID=UPI001B17EF0F|nr:hypothetical protein [Parvibaculum sp.]MBO6635237.1 hypothetical protein [Parvibaculum sp.]MBO6678470.1 hypothetical protein [Parvibaculum sp.]MBO6685748.1 hypothetical protein [Parvibaculum sp.]MBO6905760.1 hypothetical protein [Parvibaculum sp.]
MRKFLIESLLIFAACFVFFTAYYLTASAFGPNGKIIFVALAALAVGVFLFLRRRSGRRD